MYDVSTKNSVQTFFWVSSNYRHLHLYQPVNFSDSYLYWREIIKVD